MADGLTAEDRQFFSNQGYVVARGLLSADIGRFREAYVAYLDGLAAALGLEAPPELGMPLTELPFQKRLAILLGATAGTILGHLDPLLNLSMSDYRCWDDLPSAQTAPLFNLMRHERLLDAVESLIGPEIVVSPTYHVNMKLPPSDIALASEAAARNGQKLPDHGVWEFAAGGASHWHSDGHHALAGSNRITAWIPLTEATLDSGCLKMVPGSHKFGEESEARANLDEAVALPASPGDVILFDHWTVHGADANRADRLRWAFNFRYHAAAVPTDTVHLPSFLARSRSVPDNELRDPALWSGMWRQALAYIQANLTPTQQHPQIGRKDADRLRRIWPAKVPRHEDWLRLGEEGFPDRDTAADIRRILKLERVHESAAD
jgi:hypothetical protein